MGKRLSPLDVINNIREKAKLENNDFSKSQAIKLKAGKIKFQLVAKDSDYLFRARTQHMIPTVPHDDNKDNKWMVADCKGDGCPVCKAVKAFKDAGITVDEINDAYEPKYPYKNVRSLFTQNEHYLLCGVILGDQADNGNYLPKDSKLGDTHLIQFTQTALNNLMSAYEDFIDDFSDNSENYEEVPPLFAIFDGEDKAKSLTVTCRITNQPYSATFSFGKVVELEKSAVDFDKLNLLEEAPEVADEHYENCVKRIKDIQNYFIKNNDYVESKNDILADLISDDEVPFSVKEPDLDDDDFDLDL